MVSGVLAKLTLEHIKVDDWVLLRDKVQVVPELSDLLIEESDVSDEFPRCEWAEEQSVCAFALRLETESGVADKSLALEEDLKGDWLVEGVAQRDFSRGSLTDKGS